MSYLLVLWITAVSFAQQSSTARSEIIGLLQRGDSQAALARVGEALKTAPHDCSLLSLQGIALTSLNRPQPALQSFEKALGFCPTYLPALEGAAQIDFAGQSPKTASLLDRILALQPANPTAQAMLASTLRAQHRCGDALPHYEASQPLFESRPDLLQGYGSCLADTGDLKGALAVYRRLLDSHPDASIRYDVALLQWKTHADADAMMTLAPLLAAADNEPALALASKIHEEQGETPAAVALLRQAIVADPDDVDTYLDFAGIAFTHQSFQVGIDMLNAGLARLPRSAQLYLARGVLEVQLSQSTPAIADFEQAHRLDPKLSFAGDAVGMLQTQQHKGDESLAFFTAQAKLHPDDPLLEYLLAEQLAEHTADEAGNNLAAAIAAATRAADLDPTYEAAHDLLAVLYLRAKEPAKAIHEAELALAQDPNDQDALYQEILARRRSGETSQIQALTDRLSAARKENAQRQQSADRYRLQDEASH